MTLFASPSRPQVRRNRVMRVDIVQELKSQIEAAASVLRDSPHDHVLIKGADNKMLVKAGSTKGKEMLVGGSALFPTSVDGRLYLVCIASPR